MKCMNKKEWLLYLECELNIDDREEAGKHLAECPKCREIARELEGTYKALDLLPTPEPSPGFTQKIMHEIHDRRQVRGWERMVLPAVATAAALLSIGLGIFLGQSLFATSQTEESVLATAQTTFQSYGAGPLEFSGNGGK